MYVVILSTIVMLNSMNSVTNGIISMKKIEIQMVVQLVFQIANVMVSANALMDVVLGILDQYYF